jgi:hypothetical protein
MSYESHKYYNGNLYVSIAKNVKNQQLLQDLYVGIIMDVIKTNGFHQMMEVVDIIQLLKTCTIFLTCI